MVHSRSGSKKVDFVLAVEPKPGTPFHGAVEAVLSRLRQTPLLSQSISPSSYPPLVSDPIAVAIETKTVTASRNPLVQLGLMVAAIHRRLHTPPVRGATGSHPLTRTGVLMTLPLITVTDHKWEIYFACDGGDHIRLIGSLDLGSTRSLAESYMLLANLRHLKAWIRETFCPALEKWLTI